MAELVTRLVFVLGITNLIGLLLVLLSCRCMMATFVNKLWKYDWYKRFYAHHCYYWWFFILSVLAHAILAFYIFGNPL